MSAWSGEIFGDGRAASNLVGIVLLIGMTIAGALLVVAIGSTALEEAQQDSQMQVAEQSMQEISSQFLELKAAGDGGKTSIEIPDELGGDVSVLNSTTVELVANGNQSCSTGPVGMGTVIYESSNQGIVGYEAGGVWRKQGESTWMVSSPDIEYRNGRLALQVSDMSGFAAGNGEITARVDENRSERLSENISRAMYTNRTATELVEGLPESSTCQPGDIENVTLSVQGSQFARAWYTFAKSNFDDRRVSVEDRSVVEAGNPVNITYLLGDRQDPEYRITDIDAPASTSQGDDMEVDVTVENIGDFNGTAPIKLFNTTGGRSPMEFDSVSETIAANDTETVTLTVDQSALNTGSGSIADYTARIEVPDDEEEISFVVGDGAPADLWIEPLDSPSDAELGDDRELDAVIENDGGMPATETVQFYYAGERMAERTLRVNDGDDEMVTFDVPTTREGEIPLRVALEHQTESDQERTTTIEIGDLPNFELVTTTSPYRVTQNRPYEIDATVENDASNDGTLPIEIEVRNATNPSDTIYTESQSLRLNGYETDTVTFRNDSGIATPGLYEYVVEVGSDSETGTFRVGSINEPFFVAVRAGTDRSVVQQDGDFNVTAAIRNAGGQTGTQEVTVSFDGNEIASRSMTLDPGSDGTVGPVEQSLSGKSPGEYEYTVETDNTSTTGQIQVVEEFDGDFDSGDSTIQINRSITAQLTVLGTELSGIREEEYCEDRLGYDEDRGLYRYEVCYPGEIIRDPVQMAIYTDNETAEDEYHYLWNDDDLNTPETRQDQIEGADYLSKEITVTATEESPTDVSVFAESFTCDYYRGSGYIREVPGYGALEGLACDDPDPSSRININQNENPSNLVIRGDGQRVPAFGQAGPEQRDVREILGDRITDNGYLQLEDDQKVLFYELSKEEADPDNAMDTNDDPDYNDAVVLFEVVEERNTPTVSGQTDVVINDTRGPAVVEPGYDETLEVKLWNRGSDSVDGAVDMFVDGDNRTDTDFDLSGRESDWRNISIPSGLSGGTHEIEFRVRSDENETASRNLYVGEADGPYFLPNVESFEDVTRPGEPAEVEALVTNVGDNESTQDVTATVVETYGDLSFDDIPDDQERRTWSDLHLDAGTADTNTFSFETDDDESIEGKMRVRIATENASTAINITVMEPRLDIKRAIVGDQTYVDGDTIVSTNLDSMTVDVGNPVEIPRSGEVKLYMKNASEPDFEHVDTSDEITLNGNRTLAEVNLTHSDVFDPGGSDLSSHTGVYDYELRAMSEGATDRADADSIQSGEIQIVTADDVNTTAESDYISVDMNQIELS